MKQTNFAKALALSVGVLVFSGAVSYLIFAWTAPSSTPSGNNVAAPLNIGSATQTKIGGLIVSGNVSIGTSNSGYKLRVAGQSNFSQDGTTQCCSTDGFTISLAENTSTTGKKAGIQFHNSGVAEGQLRLDAGINGRELKAYSYQTDMDLHATGYVQGDQGLCIGSNCRTSWPGGVTASDCPAGQWVVGINANGTVKCNGGSGTPPWSTVSCTATTDAQLNAANRKRIFVTSGTYNGYATDTVTEVDAICQAEAQSVGLTGTYKALIRLGSTRNPYDVLAPNRTFMHCGVESSSPVWREIANSPASFLNTSLPFPVKYSPAGVLVGGTGGVTVWTNFRPTGGGNLTLLAHYWGTNNCPGCAPFYNTMYGNSSRNDLGWAYAGQYMCGEYSPGGCMSPLRALYCIQQ